MMAGLAKLVRDVGLAQDALIAPLERWSDQASRPGATPRGGVHRVRA